MNSRTTSASAPVATEVKTPGVSRIAAVQMVSAPRVADNLAEAGRLIAQAAAQGAELVALPEYFCIMGMKDTDKVDVREPEGDGPIQQFLSDAARQHGVWIVGGSAPLVSGDPKRVRNTCLVYDPGGKQMARYDKIHLFGFQMGDEQYHEARTIEPGNTPVTVDTPFGRLGLSICYDLRFPELYRAMKDIDIIFVPSAFTETTGRAHWETVLRARAIENLAYVVAPAQGGRHENGRETHGNTMIIDPWGAVLNRLPRGAGVVIADVNLSHLQRLRRNLPALSHRILL